MKPILILFFSLSILTSSFFGCGLIDDNSVAETADDDDDATIADTTAPTISSVVTGNSITLSATETNSTLTSSSIANATMTATFSEAVDSTTITTSNITLSDGSSNLGLDLTVSSDNTVVTIAPQAQLTALTDYTLTLGSSITDTAALTLYDNELIQAVNALAETTYEFSTRCATNDDFSNAATFIVPVVEANCWTFQANTNAALPGRIEITGGVLNFDGGSGDYSGQEGNLKMSKDFTSENLTATVEIASIAGFDDKNDLVALIFSASEGSNFYRADFRTNPSGSSTRCRLTTSDSNGTADTSCTNSNLDSLKIIKTGDSMEAFWINVDTTETSLGTASISLGDSYSAGLRFEGGGTGGDGDDNVITFDSFTATEAATDQD